MYHQHPMKQKIVIQISMLCERARSKAMSLAAGTAGVISVGITGDGRDRLEVVGVGVDSVCLVRCLRKKVGHADIIQVEEVKDKKPNEKPEEKKPDEKKPEEKKPPPPPPTPQSSPPPCFHPYYCHPHYPPMVVCCDEASGNCAIM